MINFLLFCQYEITLLNLLIKPVSRSTSLLPWMESQQSYQKTIEEEVRGKRGRSGSYTKVLSACITSVNKYPKFEFHHTKYYTISFAGKKKKQKPPSDLITCSLVIGSQGLHGNPIIHGDYPHWALVISTYRVCSSKQNCHNHFILSWVTHLLQCLTQY